MANCRQCGKGKTMNVKIEPRKAAARGGWLMMPLRVNVPDPGDGTWQLSGMRA